MGQADASGSGRKPAIPSTGVTPEVIGDPAVERDPRFALGRISAAEPNR